MLVLNLESDPTKTVSQVEVEDSRKTRKRNQRKRNIDLESNEVNQDCLDGNSSKISPTAKDASFEYCIDASSLTDCEKRQRHAVLTSENISLKTSLVTDRPSATLLVLNSESNPTIAASQVEVEVEGEGSGTKKKRKRQRKKRGMDSGGNRIQPNCLDGNNSKITPTGNDASLQSCIDVSSLTESEKISSHVALTSENISLKMDLVMTECGAELCQGKETDKQNEKPNGLQHNDIGEDCLQKTSLVTECAAELCQGKEKKKQNEKPNGLQKNDLSEDCLQKPSIVTGKASDIMLDQNPQSNQTTTASQIEVEGSTKKRNKNRKRNKAGNKEVQPDFLDGNSSKITPSGNDASFDSSVDASSFMESEKISTTASQVEVEGSTKKQNRNRKRNKAGKYMESKEVQPDFLDGNSSKITPIGNDASLDSSVDASSFMESEKIPTTASQVEVEGSTKKKNRNRKRNKVGKYTESKEVEPDFLDGNSSKITPSGNDASFDSSVDGSSFMESQKISTTASQVEVEGSTKKQNRNRKRNKAGKYTESKEVQPDFLDGNSSKITPSGNDASFDYCVDGSSFMESQKISTTASQVEVKSSAKKQNRNRKGNKEGKYKESKEVQPDFLDGNSSKITPVGNDASFDSCVDASSFMESQKISSHVALASENIGLNMGSVMRVHVAEFCRGNEKETEKPDGSSNNNTGDGCLHKTSLVTKRLSGTILENLGSDPAKTVSHVEAEGLEKKRKRKRKKSSTDLESNEVKPSFLDGKSSKTTSFERDASVGSCVDVSSLTDSGKISSNIVLTSPQKKKRKKKRKNGNNDVKAEEIDLNCLDIDASKTNPPVKGASFESCVDLNSLADSEKVTSHVILAPPHREKRKKRRKNGNDVHKGNDRVCDLTGTLIEDNQRTVNSVSCSNCGSLTRGSLNGGETNKKVEETNSSSLDLTKDDLSLIAKKEENPLQPLSPSPANTKVGCAKKKLLILDLNGLLVDIVAKPSMGRKRDKTIANKAVFKRPFCDNFLQFCFEIFNVGVWSSRTKRNVDSVIDVVMGEYKQKLLFRWGQAHCTQTGFMTVDNKHKPLVFKELKKLWDKIDPNLPWKKGEYNESNTLLIDDSPYKALRNPPNTAIFPHPYQYMNAEDRALGPGGDLRVYLEGLASADHVQRYVEQNPFGQQAIGERDPSWEFYSRVMGTN